MRGVARLEVPAERPALDRVREDHGRLADVLARRLERGVHLPVVVPAAGQAADLVVRQVLDHLAQPRVTAEEVLADVGARLHAVGLELPVRRGVHLVDQHAVGVLRQQRVPVAAPDDLDHVPAGAAEERLELLDDLAVAAHRAVEPLQVAVDHEREVVQFLAGGQADRAERLRLVHLAVAEECPHVRPGRVVQLAGQQVAVEPRLVDRVQRPEAHRHRGELPEVRHQPRVRVRRQAAAWVRQLLAEPVELGLGEPSLEERAGVDAGGGVTLEEHLVAGFPVILAAEEVVEPDLIQRGRGCVCGDMPADAQARPVCPGYHDRRVPPDIGADAPFDVLVAGEPGLALGRDRVDVVGAAQAGHPDLLFARPLEQAEHEVAGPSATAGARDGVEGIDPFPRLVRVDVRELRGQPVADDRVTLASGSHGVASPSAVRRLLAAVVHLACPDQSSYDSAGFSSLPNGNRCYPVRLLAGRAAGADPAARPPRMPASPESRKTTHTGYVTCQRAGPCGKVNIWPLVFSRRQIATCARGRPSVNCPNKKY